jgi:hypothetical protein
MPASPAGFLFSDYSNEGIEHDNHGGRRMSASAGDDVPPERIRVFIYGDNFVSIDGGDLTMSASGPGCLAAVARKLLAVGYDPGRSTRRRPHRASLAA